MTLCEALDWCRNNQAHVFFSPARTVVETGSPGGSFNRTAGATLEEAVAAHQSASALAGNETVPEAARRGFKTP